MIVLDASAVLEVLLNARPAARVSRRIFGPTESLHVPHLIDVEVAQVLRRIVQKKEMTAERGEQALDDLRRLPLSRYPHSLLLDRLRALRDNASACDATYLTLAESLAATLLPCDAAGHHPRHSATVEVIA
ncbi:MAG: type II toxin-antitoxin system VapC family toxin [Burkholderiaceae bacterium]|nr:type II toxin-antitoxin system VapC family toxin [Burkholderiaceae bacterium]